MFSHRSRPEAREYETGDFSTLVRVLKIELSRSLFYRSIQAFDGLWNGTGGLTKHLEELERIAEGVGSSTGCAQRFDSRPAYARASSFEHVLCSTMSLLIFLGENSSDLLQPNAVKVDLHFDDDEIKVGVSF